MSNKKFIIAIVAIFIFSLAFRIPNDTNNPEGYDTYVHYKMATFIQEKGFITWTKSPLSLTGYYPVSYQTGGILFLSMISLTTGINVKYMIIIWDIIFIIILSILIYLITNKLINNKFISMLCVLIYINTSIIISYSSWDYTSRSIFLVFFLTIIWILLSDFKNKWAILLTLIILACITHKMFILLPAVFISWIISRKISPRWINHKLSPFIILSMTLTIFFGSIYYMKIIKLGVLTYSPIHTNIQYVNLILDLFFRYSLQVGIVLILFPIAYLLLAFKKDKSKNETFLIILLMAFIPLITDNTYISYILLPILVVITAYACIYFYKNIKNELLKKGAICIILLFLMIPLFVTIIPHFGLFKTASRTYLDYPQTIKLTDFLINNTDNRSIVCNTPTNKQEYCNQITALSNNNVQSISELYNLMIADRFILDNLKYSIRLKSAVQFDDPVIGWEYTDDIYPLSVTYYNLEPYRVKKVIKFINLGFIISTYDKRSQNSLISIQKKVGRMDNIYSNKYQIVSKIQ